jgi:hypothetical protein
MADESAFEPYRRKDYLASVPADHRATAERLCALLEDAYPVSSIQLYRGFPIVVRDGEWTAGFAMRAKCPMIYCCSPHVLAEMGEELKPLMAGKSCMELRAKGGLTLEEAFELVGRAFQISRGGPGQISETDKRKRERAKAAAQPAARKAKATKSAKPAKPAKTTRRPARKA